MFGLRKTSGNGVTNSSRSAFQPSSGFPEPQELVLKIETIVESCRLIEHLEVTRRFFSEVLQRANRVGYYDPTEAEQTSIKLRALLERKERLLLGQQTDAL